MVKLRGPMFSVDARGSFADCIVYQSINRQPVAKALRWPSVSETAGQLIIRENFNWATQHWWNLHESKKQKWREYEDAKHLTGYKAFMNQFLHRTYLALWQWELPPHQGFCTVGNHKVGEFYVEGGYMAPP